eukprot:gene21731-28753_t
MASRDWMFCPQSGFLLTLDPTSATATCAVSGYRRHLSELSDIKLVQESDMEDYRRRYNLEPLVKTVVDEELAKGRVRAVTDESCPKCNHRGLEFYTMQLRSADEGQTVFY